MSIKETYVKILKQGWIPIFVRDAFDALKLAEICVRAEIDVIEVTCRRPDVVAEIKEIKSRYPQLKILVGSTVDNDQIVNHIRNFNKNMPTIKELSCLGVDGFVAQLPFMKETIEEYGRDFILIPGVETLKEAYEALQWGAHFTKFCSVEPARIKQINSDATHRIFPIFVTGGVTREKIPQYVEAGVSVLGGGWDIMLQDIYKQMQIVPDDKKILDAIMAYKKAFSNACMEHIPDYAANKEPDTEEYLKRFKYFHPF
jgi:2-keto-3-deoxy-6-phosphogluconate aldolase